MATKTTAKSPTSKAKQKATETKTVKKAVKKSAPSTEFTLFAPDANEVHLAGDFNNWNTTEFKARRFKDGTWKKMVQLKPGQYEYLFLVDGQWWTDPENPSRIANQFGSENSVVIVS
jgi:1,4-alpha-glucan branching enzyme